MTSAQIRQSFLDFFREKQHTIVPSSSLDYRSPDGAKIFTNAGMNQFVPIFLGQEVPNVDQWADVIAKGKPTRAADTQKCIRVSGKHNDLEDVGRDTYHHTFFEMLGNWSFGDYFKKEAIEWAWELLVERWKFPAQRLYATVYQPGPGEPSEFDQEAYDHWAHLFREADLDPTVHVLSGGKADNFWMMGDTGPCGPCSEVHIDLTPDGDTRGALVNKEDPQCIEIWNLVFIQFNANPDGAFTPLPQRHVDTGMGFERVTALIQDTKNLTDFSGTISNYETDIFRPIFEELEKLSGKKYGSTLPMHGSVGEGEQEHIDIAFRVIADHIRALSFAVADGIIPSNEGRGYVLRRILRRAIRYGRMLGFHEPFFFRLVNVVAKTMSNIFGEVRTKESKIKETIRREEKSFNKTLDQGLLAFEAMVGWIPAAKAAQAASQTWLKNLQTAWPNGVVPTETYRSLLKFVSDIAQVAEPISHARLVPLGVKRAVERLTEMSGTDQHQAVSLAQHTDVTHLRISMEEFERFLGQLLLAKNHISGEDAFLLYDTYGFPLDLTELLARERGLTVDVAGFEELMEQQRQRARAARRSEVVEILRYEPKDWTRFVGYRRLNARAKVLDIVNVGEKTGVILDRTPFYAAMGGQVGDTGTLKQNEREWSIIDTQKKTGSWLHLIETQSAHPHTNIFADSDASLPTRGSRITASVNAGPRRATQRHHTATHLLHWALHKVIGPEAVQKGSYVGPDKLTFDFASAPLSPQQVRDVERLVNAKIVEDSLVSSMEIPYAEARQRTDILQFFGDKYGDNVRVLQIGGQRHGLNGYSMELCGGTHVTRTGEIGLFRVVRESAISTGVRRIEAVAGLQAYEDVQAITESYARLATILKAQTSDLEKRIKDLLQEKKELEKAQASSMQREGAIYVRDHCRPTVIGTVPAWIDVLPLRERGILLLLHNVVQALKAQGFNGVAVLAGVDSTNTVQLVAYVSPDLTTRFHAGKIIQTIAPIVGGKGGGRPESAQGAGKDVSKVGHALEQARKLLAS